MSNAIIKRKEKLPDIEPFSFEPFDVNFNRTLTEEEQEGQVNALEEGEPSGVPSEPQMEVFRPPDLEELVIKRLHEAEREAQEIKNRAFEEGRSEGYRVGYEQGIEDAKELAKQCGEVLESLSGLPSKIMNDYSEWLINAAFSIAKHIIQEELSSKPQTFLALVGRLVKEMEGDFPITVFLNPEDVSMLRLGVDFDEWARMQGRVLKLAEDPLLERGSCRLETDIALLDATLEKIMREMKREILMEAASHRIGTNGN